MKPVQIGRLARAEIDSALADSRRRNPARAAVFQQTIDAALATISANPQIAAVVSRAGDRMYVLGRRFPYSIVYVEEPTVVRVIAFARHGRQFRYWRRRLRP
jgi:plasmid stabilization system protein ParE